MFSARLSRVRSRIYHRYFKFPPHRRRQYETLCKGAHPLSARKRSRLARNLVDDCRSAPELRDSDGYAVWRDQHPLVDEVIREARSILAAGEMERMKQSCVERRMNFAVRRVDERLSRDSPFLDFALDARVTATVAAYLGVLPVLHGIYLWYSPNTDLNADRNSSQLFHIDPTGHRQVKVFVHVEDVSEDSGPLTVVPAEASKKLYPLFTGTTGSISDEEVERVVGKDSVVALTGPAGTVSLADTSSCFHFGSRPGRRNRVLIHFHFVSPYAPLFPFFGRLHNPRYAHLLTRDTPETEWYLLGAR